MEAVIERDPARGLIRKAGVMGVVIASGGIKIGDAISIVLPPPPHDALRPV